MVRSRYLTAEHLIQALRAGDFYASSGVTLSDVAYDKANRTLSLSVEPTAGATYTTEFIATLKPADDHQHEHAEEHEHEHADDERIGVVVATVQGESASYQLSGNELYVRAVVTSSEPADDPSFQDQQKQAWTQPVGWQP